MTETAKGESLEILGENEIDLKKYELYPAPYARATEEKLQKQIAAENSKAKSKSKYGKHLLVWTCLIVAIIAIHLCFMFVFTQDPREFSDNIIVSFIPAVWVVFIGALISSLVCKYVFSNALNKKELERVRLQDCEEYKEKFLENAKILSSKYLKITMLNDYAKECAQRFISKIEGLYRNDAIEIVECDSERIWVEEERLCASFNFSFERYRMENVENALQRMAIAIAIAKLVVQNVEKILSKQKSKYDYTMQVVYPSFSEFDGDEFTYVHYEGKNGGFVPTQSW